MLGNLLHHQLAPMEPNKQDMLGTSKIELCSSLNAWLEKQSILQSNFWSFMIPIGLRGKIVCKVFIFRASDGLVIVATRVVTSLYRLEETSVRFLSTCLSKLYKHYSYLSSIYSICLPKLYKHYSYLSSIYIYIYDEKKKNNKKRQWSLISLPIIDTLETGEGVNSRNYTILMVDHVICPPFQ